MNDPRVDRLAELVVGYALGLGKGDVVRLDGFDVSAPLALALYRSALRAGAYPYTNIVPTGLNGFLVAEGSDEQLAYIAPTQWHEIEELDAIVTIWSEQNTRSFSNADEQRHSAYIATQRKLSNRRWERISDGQLRWCGTLHPTHAHAQDAGMSLDEYERFFHAACHTDADAPEEYWRSVAGALHSRADELAGVRELRILGPDTDLRVARRRPHAGSPPTGTHNLPDGEVFTSPVETGTEGEIRFTFPAVFTGHEVEDVRLRFEGGRVVDAEAVRGQTYLRELLDLDEGARRAGEIAFGLNYEIDRFTRNILLDEKIGGTMHLALGASFAQAGGQNSSGLHWDLICDLRADGEVYADGEPSGRPACSSRSPPPWKSPRAAVPDPRVERLAEVAIGYSTAVQPGDLVLIEARRRSPRRSCARRSAPCSAAGRKPARALLARRRCARGAPRGGQTTSSSAGSVRRARTRSSTRTSASCFESEVNTRSLTGADPARQALAHKARKPLRTACSSASRPGSCAGWARSSRPRRRPRTPEMSLAEYEDFVYARRAARPGRSRSPVEASSASAAAAGRLASTRARDPHRRRGHRPHARRRAAARGSTATADEQLPRRRGLHRPVEEDATEGIVRYSFPAVHGGREVHDIALRFKAGRVVDASAAKGEEFLTTMLDQDTGARILGELALGTNYAIREYTKNTLFDEKIGGTFHAALGAAYPEIGRQEQERPALGHGLRPAATAGEVYADGKLIYRNGRFLDR